MTRGDLPFTAGDDDDVVLRVADLGVARALWEGVPTARLLARIRLHRDEHDLVDLDQRASGVDFAESSWDVSLARLLGSTPSSLERVKRGVARHAQAAWDEGALAAGDGVLAALVHTLLSASDADASPAEAVAESLPIEDPVAVACGRLDERLGRSAGDRRGPAFEACLDLVQRSESPAWQLDVLRKALGALGAIMDATIHDSGVYPKLGHLPASLHG